MIACGIDSGARSTKAVVLDDAGGMLSSAMRTTGSSPRASAEAALEEALRSAGVAPDAQRCVTATGYGRELTSADRRLTEITCHARGALHAFPAARLVLDVGGQDSKFIAIDAQGEVSDFVMNDRCAAGTGRFLEVISTILGVDVSQLSDLARRSHDPALISSVCVVFTESEVISLIGQGRAAEDIAAGVLRSMAARMKGVMAHIIPREPAVFVGGVAKNAAFGDILSAQIGVRFSVPQEPQLNGALGAALFSLEKPASRGYTR